MKYNYFTFNGIEYAVVFDNSLLKLLKKENENYVLLREEEQEKILSSFNYENGYQYDSNQLVEIINSNNQLENKEYLYNFLQWLENIIPLDCRQNFYHNIKTLKTTLNLDIDFSKLSDELNEHEIGGNYNTRNNELIMKKKSILQLWNVSKSANNPKEFFWKHYAQVLLHELLHMSSSKYDVETEISLCGFDKFPPDKESDKNRGLTEGFTEILSMAGVPGTVEISSVYYVEMCLINQIIQIIGLDVFLKSYFSNLGTALLEQELCSIIDDMDQAFQLFRNIEFNYQIGRLSGKQNILGNIQLTLLNYLDKKCEQLISDGNINGIENILNIYEQMMVTPEKLEIMNKKPNNYEGITESLLKFKMIKEKYVNLFSDNHVVNSVL